MTREEQLGLTFGPQQTGRRNYRPARGLRRGPPSPPRNGEGKIVLWYGAPPPAEPARDAAAKISQAEPIKPEN